MEKASKLKSGHSRNPPMGGSPTCPEGVKSGCFHGAHISSCTDVDLQFSPQSHVFFFRGKTEAPFWSLGPVSQQCVLFMSFRSPQLLLPQDEEQKDSPFGLYPLPFPFQRRTTELKEGAEPVFFPWDYAHVPVCVRVLRPHKNPLSGLSWGTSPAQTPGSKRAGHLTCSHVCLP